MKNLVKISNKNWLSLCITFVNFASIILPSVCDKEPQKLKVEVGISSYILQLKLYLLLLQKQKKKQELIEMLTKLFKQVLKVITKLLHQKIQ